MRLRRRNRTLDNIDFRVPIRGMLWPYTSLAYRIGLGAGMGMEDAWVLGRALAPIELAVGQWGLVQRAARGWQNLCELLAEVPPRQPRTALPRPRAKLEAKGLTVLRPGERQAALKSVNLLLEPGQAMGVIGPSGSGKTFSALRIATGLGGRIAVIDTATSSSSRVSGPTSSSRSPSAWPPGSRTS